MADAPALPPELEARLAAVERQSQANDFDARSWFWMLLIGLVIPLALIALGWLVGPGAS